MSKTLSRAALEKRREGYCTLQDVADLLDVEYNSARTYHGRAEINRRRGEVKPWDLPPPDEYFGRSPVWYPETIHAFLANRPGRGTGGGRPQRDEA